MRRAGRRGTTLFEMVVYTAIFGLVGVGVAQSFIIGNRWYMQNRAIIDAEANANLAPRRLMKELMESHLSAITFYPNTTSPSSIPGVVFVSPRDPSNNNNFGYNPATGSTRWYKWVCYYVDDDPNNPGLKAVFRKEYALWSSVDARIDAVPSASMMSGKDTTWFQSLNAVKSLIAHHIAPASVSSVNGGSVNGGLDVYSFTNGAADHNTPSNPINIDVMTQDNYYSATKNLVHTNIMVSVRN